MTDSGSLRSGHGAILRVACVGDSITEGNELGNPGHSYPARLGALLGAGWIVGNFGRRRSTALRRGDCPYHEQPEFAEALRFRPDRVVLGLGTNDSKPFNWAHAAEFERDYAALVESFVGLESRPRVFICPPPPAFLPSRFTVDGAVIKSGIVPRIEAIARRRNLPLIDLHGVFEGRHRLFPDGVHPDEEGTLLLAQTVCAALRATAPCA
jgi:lysophospholipase L1-like esterase